MRILAFAIIAVLLVVIVVLGRAVVRLENYHYANFIGRCSQFDITNTQQRIAREDCLDRAQTRPHWFWHILYGTRLLP